MKTVSFSFILVLLPLYALVKSVHGRDLIFEEKMKEYSYIGLLTDNKNTPQEIARRLCVAGYDKKRIIVGENLSYKDEVIKEYSARELSRVEKTFHINAVIIEGDRDGSH